MTMETFRHILVRPICFTGQDGISYTIHPLTRDVADRDATAIVAIHNLIPKVRFQHSDLLRETSSGDERAYLEKWRLSFIVKQGEVIIGLLLAYMRAPAEQHPMFAVYVHRFAIHQDFQRRGIGTQLLAFATAAFFEAAPWLLTVSIQTNDDSENSHVIRMYERLRFRFCYRVTYPEKLDRLLEVSRADHLESGFTIPGRYDMTVPELRANDVSNISDPFFHRGTNSAAIAYFGTGSREKREQYRYLLRCYGLQLFPLTRTLKLSEPQVEGEGLGPETALVTVPLKLYSRFAALANTYPVIVEDTMLFIEHFNNEYSQSPILPGADTKRWWRALGATGVLNLMKGSEKRKATYVCQLGVAMRNAKYEYFRFDLHGRVATDVRQSSVAVRDFPYTNATFFHTIFVPDGSDSTLAEMDSSTFVRFD